MKPVFSAVAWEDYLYWQKADKSSYLKILNARPMKAPASRNS
jgi:Txe/YoeB family toxin of Txe-Axe toxin-antitoxin module